MKEQEGKDEEEKEERKKYFIIMFICFIIYVYLFVSEWYHAKQKTGTIFLIMHTFKHTQK